MSAVLLASCGSEQAPDDDFIISVPDGFSKLSKEQIKTKYGDGANTPKVVYADTLDRMRISIAYGQQNVGDMEQLSVKNIPEVKTAFASSRNVKNWHVAEMINVKGKQAIFLDFETSAIESEEYNIRNTMVLYYAVGKLNIVNINCTTDLEEKCQKISASVLDSLTFE